MNEGKDRQQFVRALIYLGEIAILIAAVALAVRFLPGQKGGGDDGGTEASGETGPLTEPAETDRELPKETEEEKKIRTAALQQGLKEATEAPLAIAESAAKIFPMAEAVVKRGNKGAVSDGLIAAMLARTAVVGALFNVKINLASIKDESYVSELGGKVEKLESDAIFCEKSILCLSKLSDTVYNR